MEKRSQAGEQKISPPQRWPPFGAVLFCTEYSIMALHNYYLLEDHERHSVDRALIALGSVLNTASVRYETGGTTDELRECLGTAIIRSRPVDGTGSIN